MDKKCIIMGKYNLSQISQEYMKLLDKTDILSEKDINLLHITIKETLELIERGDITKNMIMEQENKIKNNIDPIIRSLSIKN